jgi:hypothetical protein
MMKCVLSKGPVWAVFLIPAIAAFSRQADTGSKKPNPPRTKTMADYAGCGKIQAGGNSISRFVYNNS